MCFNKYKYLVYWRLEFRLIDIRFVLLIIVVYWVLELDWFSEVDYK